jgi:hypothetical protein
MREHETRRNFPRYVCSGAAEVFQQGKRCGWGTVSEIGSGGCYIETGSPLPAGLPVQLRLTIAGLMLETVAVVAWVTPQVGMGMRFEAASPEAQSQLSQFLQKVTAGAEAVGGGSFAHVPELELEVEDNGRTEHRANQGGSPGAYPGSSPAISPEAAPRILARILQRVHQTGSLTEHELLAIVNAGR